jgi:signal transduction histidine kinase
LDAQTLVQVLTLLALILIFATVLRNAVRDPYESNVHAALFFGALVVAVGFSSAADVIAREPPVWFRAVLRTMAVALPYLLLRLVADFTEVPRWLIRVAGFGLVLAIAAVLAWPDLPPAVTVAVVAYFVGFQLYAAVKFLRGAHRGHGVTRRRMQAAALGTVLLSAAILVAGVRAAAGTPEEWGELFLQVALLGSGFAYLVGFSPPSLLRRAWQQPELRDFLRRVPQLPAGGELTGIVRLIEEGASAAFGGQRAGIVLWDRESGTLRPPGDAPGGAGVKPGQLIAGRAFEEGRAIFAANAPKEDPDHAEVYQQWEARAVLSAPIVAGDRRLGVLSLFGRHTPMFAEDDLEIVQLLADQAAIALEYHRLLEEASGVRAREEATRLRDDFLSAAAHDLRTPLMSISGSAQLLERKASALSGDARDLESLRRISREAARMKGLVARLLDVGRAETGRLVAEERERVSLSELAREVCERQSTEHHPCVVEDEAPVFAPVDPLRIEQLLENLLENGKKYSPRGGEVTIRLWEERGPRGDEARIAVRDRGIGIPPADHPHVFERFRRAGNVDDRRFSGMGLGLYICRVIAEEHGGRIWLDSRVGEGSTFHVALPLSSQSPQGEP